MCVCVCTSQSRSVPAAAQQSSLSHFLSTVPACTSFWDGCHRPQTFQFGGHFSGAKKKKIFIYFLAFSSSLSVQGREMDMKRLFTDNNMEDRLCTVFFWQPSLALVSSFIKASEICLQWNNHGCFQLFGCGGFA